MLKKYKGILLLLPLLVIFNINELAVQTNEDKFILDLPETSNKINFNFYGTLQLTSNVDLQNFVISEGLPGNGFYYLSPVTNPVNIRALPKVMPKSDNH